MPTDKQRKPCFKKCPYCLGRGKVRIPDPAVHRRIMRTVAWVNKNVRKGTVLWIGAHPRKVVSVTKPKGTLTLVKIRPSCFKSNTTTYLVTDYYRHLKGKAA